LDLALCTGGIVILKRPCPNCYHKVGSTESSRMSLYSVALRSLHWN
jgi:hypothetical protein